MMLSVFCFFNRFLTRYWFGTQSIQNSIQKDFRGTSSLLEWCGHYVRSCTSSWFACRWQKMEMRIYMAAHCASERNIIIWRCCWRPCCTITGCFEQMIEPLETMQRGRNTRARILVYRTSTDNDHYYQNNLLRTKQCHSINFAPR